MEDEAMEEPEVAPEGDTDAEAAMAEEPAAEEDAVPEATAGQEPATDSSTTATDDDGEAEAAKDDSADDTNDAADGDVDAEADLVPDNGALRYALPDPAIADRDDYLGTFNSYGQFFTSYGQASEGVSPQFVIPREFNACDLTTLLPPPRAALYMGTATIADDQVLVGLEPGRSDDANSPNVDQLLIIDQNEIDECIVSVRSPRQE